MKEKLKYFWNSFPKLWIILIIVFFIVGFIMNFNIAALVLFTISGTFFIYLIIREIVKKMNK